MIGVRFTRLAAPMLLAVAVAACGSEEKTSGPGDQLPPPPAPPVILSFTAEPGTIAEGDTTTLRWTTKDAVSLELRDEHGTPVPVEGAGLAEGSVAVRPDETTAYTLTATGADASTGPATRTVTVTVTRHAEAPTVESFTASAAVVPVGGETVLSWKTTGADEVVLTDDLGAPVDLAGAGPAEGQVAVYPTRSTTYTLAAEGPGGSATATVSVQVVGLPKIAKFVVDPPTPVRVGDSVTLIWETANTTRVVIRDGDATVVDTAESAGSHPMVLHDNATLTLEATGLTGTATATAEARVRPGILAFSASARAVRAGDPVVLTWETADADRAAIEGPGGYLHAIPAGEVAAGSVTVTVAERGDFVLQAFRQDVPASARVTVDVTQEPRIRTMAVDRPEVTATRENPASVLLSWTQAGAESCSLFANGVPVNAYQGFPCGPTGSAAVTVTASTTLRLVAENASGSHAATAEVTAFPPARVAAFAVNPDRRLSPGEAIELSWTVTDAVAVTLAKNAELLPVDGMAVSSFVDHVDFESVYTLTARNVLGDETVATRTVFVGAPVILDAALEPDFVGTAEAFTVSWTADGGDEIVVVGPSGVEHTTSDPEEIARGTASLAAPALPGTYTYQVIARNEVGESLPAELQLVVTDGPLIRTFAVDPAAISLGGTANLHWTVADDRQGQRPVLELADDRGTTYPPIPAAQANEGSLSVTPDAEGSWAYTLTATTPGQLPSTKTVVLDVALPPHLESFAASPSEASTQGGTVAPEVELSWTSENAVEIAIFVMGADGYPVSPPVHRLSLEDGADPAELEAGSATVHPTETTVYRARATNRVGTVALAEVKVVVDPVEVVAFEAVPPEISEGGVTHLTWTTENADGVALDPLPIARLGDTFVDISGEPTSHRILFASGTNLQNVPFPAGFTFPFEGVERTEIQVSTEGWAGFRIGNQAPNDTPRAFPNPEYAEVAFALFWCSLDPAGADPTGELWIGMATDAKGDHFVVQWKDWSFSAPANNPSNLDFELILRPNGDFEYRYGSMTAKTEALAAGATCGIGFQGTDATRPHAQLVPFKTAAAGGLAGTGFGVTMAPPTSGAVEASPTETTTYTLTAWNADTEETVETRVTVWRKPVFEAVTTSPVSPMAGIPFDVKWTVREATRVRVLDPTGTPLCVVTDPDAFPDGGCRIAVPDLGPAALTLEAENGPLHQPVSRTTYPLQLVLLPYLAVESFEVSPSAPTPGQTVTVSWTTAGAYEMELLACPAGRRTGCQDITPAHADPAAGSVTHVVNASTEFVLRILDIQGRAIEEVAGAWTDGAAIDSLTADATQVAAGEPVTLTWNTTGAYTVDLGPDLLAQETTGSLEFIEIDGDGGIELPRSGWNTDSGLYLLDFPSGFRFPWFGFQRTRAQMSVDGWLGWDPSNPASYPGNEAFPNRSYAVAIAPFWDDLRANSPARVLWKMDQTPEGDRYIVVEWKDFELYSSTATSLNFQVILWENGDFDLRYGAMVATDSAYEDRVAGSGATLGFQGGPSDPFYTLSHDTAVPGGLSHRSWRFRPRLPGDGSLTVYPAASTTYELCAQSFSGHRTCEEVRVVVVRPGDLLFTEAMIAPPTPEAEWFELRNMSADPVDLAGFTVASGPGEEFTLPATPLVVPPGGYVVFARSGDPAHNGGLVPDVVYGDALTLDDSVDGLTLSTGAVLVDELGWDLSWTIPSDRSIAVEPTWIARDPRTNDGAFAWCPSTATYGDGTFGGSPGSDGDGCVAPPAP